jgi:hypothetical protein
MWNDSIYVKSIQFSLSCGNDKIDCKMIDGIFWVILYCIVPNQLCTFSFTGRLWKSICYVGCTIHWNELQDTFLRQPVNYSFPTDTLASLLKNGGESTLNWKDCFPKKSFQIDLWMTSGSCCCYGCTFRLHDQWGKK